MESFFDGRAGSRLTVRKLTEADRSQLAQWIAADSYHSQYDADLFYREGTESIVFEDERGAILYVNLAKSIRAFVQFAPGENERSRLALPEAFAFVRVGAKKSGFRELLFESVSLPVIRFCKRRLGFHESPHEFIAVL